MLRPSLLPFSCLPLLLTACAGPETADTPAFATDGPAERALAEELAAGALRTHLDTWGVHDITDLTPTRVVIDALSTAHTRVQAHLNGVPVFGSEAIAHFDAWGNLAGVTDNIERNVDVDTTPSVEPDDAVETAVAVSGGWTKVSNEPEAELFVLRHDGADHLVWRVQVEQLGDTPTPARPCVFVDAHDGTVAWSYDNLHTASGTAYYSGSVTINTTKSGSKYYLEDTTRDVGTYSFGNTTSTTSYLTDSDNNWTSDSTAVQAHYNAEMVYDFYSDTFGRDGLDGSGGPTAVTGLDGSTGVIAGFVHYSKKYANAYWGGDYMVYGDGDGVWLDAVVSVDISGHEMTHGVTADEANFTYSGESGGLDEGIADIFGAMVERYVDGASSAATWKIGEDAYTPSKSGDALRYLDDPAADGYSMDYYSSRAKTTDVHYNSGIVYLSFYLLSEGGAHPTRGGSAMTGIGEDKASKIWYRALTTYLTSSSDFADARDATLSAATDYYGASSTEYAAVEDAWAMVGVGSSSGGGSSSCSGYDNSESGSLTAGSSAYEPGSSSYYHVTTTGTHKASLTGPSGSDFDLYLQRYNSTTKKWSVVTSSTGTSATKTVSKSVTNTGYFRYKITASSGSGSYTLCYTTP